MTEQIVERKVQEDRGRNFFAIIPATVRYNKNIKPLAKLIWAEISCLTNVKGFCFCTNGYLSKCFDVDKSTISRYIKSLEDENLIKVVVYKDDSGAFIERRIYPLISATTGDCLNSEEGYCIEETGCLTDERRGFLDAIHNNNNININNNINNLSEDSLRSSSQENSSSQSSEEQNGLEVSENYSEESQNSGRESPLVCPNGISEQKQIDERSNSFENKEKEKVSLKEREVAPWDDPNFALRASKTSRSEVENVFLNNSSSEVKTSDSNPFFELDMVRGNSYTADGNSPKKVKAAKKARAKKLEVPPTPSQLVKSHYLENVKKLTESGKISILRPTVNNQPINARLKSILEDVSVDNLNRALDAAMNDEWIVEKQYNLQIMLSDNVINRLLNNLPKIEGPKPEMKHIRVVPGVCSVCGEEFNSFGYCSWCS